MLDSKNGKIEKIMTIFSQINFRNNLFPHFWPTSEQKFEKRFEYDRNSEFTEADGTL